MLAERLQVGYGERSEACAVPPAQRSGAGGKGNPSEARAANRACAGSSPKPPAWTMDFVGTAGGFLLNLSSDEAGHG